jgi:hypothetical protein
LLDEQADDRVLVFASLVNAQKDGGSFHHLHLLVLG